MLSTRDLDPKTQLSWSERIGKEIGKDRKIIFAYYSMQIVT